VLAYKGNAQQSVTIVSVNGVAASTASTATGIAGLSFQCNTLSGTSPTITFACTTSFVSPNGTIPIVIKVGTISITKVFTYSIAFKGTAGSAGANATAYWLVSSTGVVQKTSASDVTLTPSTLTFTGKSKTGTNAPIDYQCRWIISYSLDGSTYVEGYKSTTDEVSKEFSANASYKSIRARMYLAGGFTTLLDEQIIPIVTDGAIGATGADAVTFQIYSSNGYALSINNPSITLQTFAYTGDVEITAGVYQWYKYVEDEWVAITESEGGVNPYLIVAREDVAFSRNYMCKLLFNDTEYTGVATVEDKSDENKVFTSKPFNYSVGDIWIVGSDYTPSEINTGTVLKAQYTNVEYLESDWVSATNYDDNIAKLREEVDKYNEYFSFDTTNALIITAKDENDNVSPFSTTLASDRLSFNQGTEAVAYIQSNKMKIREAEIESPLTITGRKSGSTVLQYPVLNIGNFSIIVESNGSLSIVANT
jgi:hypothetical protein